MPNSNVKFALKNGDFSIQIGIDGRVWININGRSFLRFKPINNKTPETVQFEDVSRLTLSSLTKEDKSLILSFIECIAPDAAGRDEVITKLKEEIAMG